MPTMYDETLAKDAKSDIQSYEDDIPLKGYNVRLTRIKAAYRELATLTKAEGERIVASLTKPEEISEEEFAKRNKLVKEDAFRIPISVVGLALFQNDVEPCRLT